MTILLWVLHSQLAQAACVRHLLFFFFSSFFFIFGIQPYLNPTSLFMQKMGVSYPPRCKIGLSHGQCSVANSSSTRQRVNSLLQNVDTSAVFCVIQAKLLIICFCLDQGGIQKWLILKSLALALAQNTSPKARPKHFTKFGLNHPPTTDKLLDHFQGT